MHSSYLFFKALRSTQQYSGLFIIPNLSTYMCNTQMKIFEHIYVFENWYDHIIIRSWRWSKICMHDTVRPTKMYVSVWLCPCLFPCLSLLSVCMCLCLSACQSVFLPHPHARVHALPCCLSLVVDRPIPLFVCVHLSRSLKKHRHPPDTQNIFY